MVKLTKGVTQQEELLFDIESSKVTSKISIQIVDTLKRGLLEQGVSYLLKDKKLQKILGYAGFDNVEVTNVVLEPILMVSARISTGLKSIRSTFIEQGIVKRNNIISFRLVNDGTKEEFISIHFGFYGSRLQLLLEVRSN